MSALKILHMRWDINNNRKGRRLFMGFGRYRSAWQVGMKEFKRQIERVFALEHGGCIPNQLSAPPPPNHFGSHDSPTRRWLAGTPHGWFKQLGPSPVSINLQTKRYLLFFWQTSGKTGNSSRERARGEVQRRAVNRTEANEH